MKSKLSFVALAVLLLAAPARANQLWTWSGDCMPPFVGIPVLPCRHAIFGVVVTDDYIPGTFAPLHGQSVFLAALYADDGGEVFSGFDFAGGNGIVLELPVASGAGEGQLVTETALFRSRSDGTWRAAFENGATGCHFDQPGNPNCNYDVSGINGTWTRVPRPSTLALVAIGLVGLVGLYRLMAGTFLAAVTLTLLLCGVFSAADANLIWDWTGDCNGVVTIPPGGGVNGCAGQAHFHAVTTDAYIPGDTFPDPNLFPPFTGQDQLATLLEARYTDEHLTFDFLGGGEFGRVVWLVNGHSFRLPAELGDPNGSVLSEGILFTTSSTGWRFAGEGLRVPLGCGDLGGLCAYDARGTNGVWTRVAVPEPATLVLLGVGLVGLVGVYLLTEETSSRGWRRLRFRRSSATGT